MSNHLSILYTLNGWLYKRAHKINVPLDFDGHTDFELFRDHIFGACSYFLEGKNPIDVEDRLHWMGEYCSRTVQKLHIEIRYEWSGRDRYLWFVLMMHAWVLLTFAKHEDEIQTIPHELENFEWTDVGIVSYFMQELGRHDFPSIGSEFAESFTCCQGVVIRGLAGEIMPSEFAEARVAFEKLETLFDSLWVDEPRCVALRGYLAGIGFWLELAGDQGGIDNLKCVFATRSVSKAGKTGNPRE